MTKAELVSRITNYLQMGGLWNPEMADHDAVRDLLIDCREALKDEPAHQLHCDACGFTTAICEHFSEQSRISTPQLKG